MNLALETDSRRELDNVRLIKRQISQHNCERFVWDAMLVKFATNRYSMS